MWLCVRGFDDGMSLYSFVLHSRSHPNFAKGTTTIFARAGLMVSSGFLLAIVATYSAEHLVIH